MWLWRLMYTGAAVGFALVVTTVVLLLWFLVEIGFGWITAVVLVLVAWLAFSSVKNRGRGFDIRK